MFNSRGRGPKPSKWTHKSNKQFMAFFARRSEQLNEAEKEVEPPLVEATGAGLKWLFTGIGGEEPAQVLAVVGAPIRSIVLDVTSRCKSIFTCGGRVDASRQRACSALWRAVAGWDARASPAARR
jgi:hypothetical protein